MDSDFSIDENDEPVSDHEQEDTKRKRRTLVTKAYKEPKPASASQAAAREKRVKREKKETKVIVDNTGIL